jgi:TRAP-type C4-dicarboxylate transport system permease small subunit
MANRLVRYWRSGTSAVSGVLFLALFGVFIIQIGARFGLNMPLAWTDEAAVILYLWVILWTAAWVVPEREHVVFDLLWNLLVGGLAGVALPASWDYVHFMGREGSPVLGISFMWIDLPFVMLLVALVLRSAWAVVQTLRGQGLETELRL